ncbi:MAG TPA: hypothetical protein VK763_03180 [Terriglobales bacterium]|nr:hypothetical protein [Terriglobales bacterium]
MPLIGKILSGLGGLCYVVFGLGGFILSLAIVNQVTNFWGFAIAFFLFPVTFAAAPWYALVHWGTWIPLAVNYGGLIGSGILRGIGKRLNPD